MQIALMQSARALSNFRVVSRQQISAPVVAAPLRSRSRSLNTTTMASARVVVSTDQAPGAVGPYSQAIKAGGMVYVSGQVALVPGTKDFAAEDVGGQTEQVMKNLEAILKEAGSDFGKVVKCTILLADMADFGVVNEIYGKRFPVDPPARATFAVKGLPLGALVEIDCVAIAE